MPKSQVESVYLVLGDQLFPKSHVPFKKGDHVLMIEDYELCTHFRYHKNKIIFFLISMREYRDELQKQGIQVTYYDATHALFKKNFASKVSDFIKNHKEVKNLHYYVPSDRFFRTTLDTILKKQRLSGTEHGNPMFLTSEEEFNSYLNGSKKPFMMTFYQQQRKRLHILLNKKGEPEGGKWSFDTENRKKYPKGIEIPPLKIMKVSHHFADVEKVVETHFQEHPGDTQHFWLPTNRRQSLQWLDHFIETKFLSFGPYEDAIKSDDTFGFHSVISPMLNNGMILPDEVVARLLKKGEEMKIPLASTEGYIRQVIGWREFVKGIYDHFEERMNTQNFWKHKRSLTEAWYTGQTGIPPLDDSITKAQTFGYTHHIERLMVLSNMMLLCEIDPKQVHQWFMEMYVDSADWVMAANVYGMGQMSEGGIFSTKPYICGSNYIIKMSDYKKGDWCEVMDGLYWRFVHKNKSFFAKNPRMSMMAKMLEKMDANRREKIFQRADQFIQEYTR